jgi:HemY protein
MIRALIYLLLLAGLAIAFAWFAEHPGQLTVSWPGYQIEITLFWFTVAILIAMGVLFFLLTLIGRLIASPRRLRRHLKNRRRARGYAALRRGIFAVGAGDESTAARYAVEARRTMPNEALTELLQAQSAQLSGDRRTAQRIFEAMSEDPETRLLGLRGLFLEASREGQMEAAEQYASRAMVLNPNLPWPVHALFEMQCKARHWHGALETLAVARNHRHIDKRVHDRRRAVLLTAQAQELEEKDSGRAIDLAMEAHRMAPDFVPAAVIAGRILASQGNTARAARVLAKTWQYTPHPDLALGYAYVRPGDSPRDRLARIKSLIVMTPDEPEARIALASAAVDARDWQEAREALQPLLGRAATARVCALMARIEGGENRDAGKVREWLAKAVRAPRDPVWMADGVISNEWQPVSPVSGALDAFQWCVPLDQSKTANGDPLLEEISALSRELETVARQIGDASLEVNETQQTEKAEPLTITVKAEETTVSPPEPQNEPEAVAPADQETRTAQALVPAAADDKKRVPADTAEPSEKPKKTDQDALSSSALARGAARAREEADRLAAARAQARSAAKHTVVKIKDAPVGPAAKKTMPKIFVPDRPPDDPGPGSPDLDEASRPYMQVRNPLKQQSS